MLVETISMCRITLGCLAIGTAPIGWDLEVLVLQLDGPVATRGTVWATLVRLVRVWVVHALVEESKGGQIRHVLGNIHNDLGRFMIVLLLVVLTSCLGVLGVVRVAFGHQSPSQFDTKILERGYRTALCRSCMR